MIFSWINVVMTEGDMDVVNNKRHIKYGASLQDCIDLHHMIAKASLYRRSYAIVIAILDEPGSNFSGQSSQFPIRLPEYFYEEVDYHAVPSTGYWEWSEDSPIKVIDWGNHPISNPKKEKRGFWNPYAIDTKRSRR